LILTLLFLLEVKAFYFSFELFSFFFPITLTLFIVLGLDGSFLLTEKPIEGAVEFSNLCLIVGLDLFDLIEMRKQVVFIFCHELLCLGLSLGVKIT
jgi:hypothetical protein